MTLTRALLAVLLAAACAAPQPSLTEVVVPGTPQVLAVDGDALLVGVQRGGAPALVRVGAAVTEVPLRPSTGYGATASWTALSGDGARILGVGGERGGAHGNVRWSVWTGTATGVAEHTQAFTTFGGWGAGDLVGAVLAPTGPAVVGSWQSDGAGLDVAVWTAQGDEWTRRPSTGTPLASTPAAQGFATSATRRADGVLVTGWQAGGGGQVPVVWSLGGPDPRGWVRTALPGAGTADAASCAGAVCAVAGRVGGRLALWSSTGGAWSAVPGLPPVAVGETDPVAAPVLVGDRIVQVVADGGGLARLDVDAEGVTRHALAGTGPVRAAAGVGPALYVLAGDPPRLWRAALPAP